MATFKVFPYSYTSTLGPGQDTWLSFGPHEDFGHSGLSITAIPFGTVAGTHVLKVENINITNVQGLEGTGILSGLKSNFYVGFSVKNNGNTVITGWYVRIGLITP